MTKELFLAFGIIAAIPLIPVGAHAQGAPQTIAKYKVDVTNVSTGYRGSKLVGAPVTNQNDEKIGTILSSRRTTASFTPSSRWAASSASVTSWSRCPSRASGYRRIKPSYPARPRKR